MAVTDSMHKLQDMVQRIQVSEEAQEEVEMSVQVAGLVSSCTLPQQETSAGRSRQMACSSLLSRRARDT